LENRGNRKEREKYARLVKPNFLNEPGKEQEKKARQRKKSAGRAGHRHQKKTTDSAPDFAIGPKKGPKLRYSR